MSDEKNITETEDTQGHSASGRLAHEPVPSPDVDDNEGDAGDTEGHGFIKV